MNFQKCPVCNGVGTVSGGQSDRAGDSNTWVAISVNPVCCRVCEGAGIINELTGLPPKIRKAVNRELKDGKNTI